MPPNTFSVNWEIRLLYDDYMWYLSAITPFRRLILCLRNRNYMSDKVRHLFQTVLWWNSFIFFFLLLSVWFREILTQATCLLCSCQKAFPFSVGTLPRLRWVGECGCWSCSLLPAKLLLAGDAPFIVADEELPEKLLQIKKGQQYCFCKSEHNNPIFIANEAFCLEWWSKPISEYFLGIHCWSIMYL